MLEITKEKLIKLFTEYRDDLFDKKADFLKMLELHKDDIHTFLDNNVKYKNYFDSNLISEYFEIDYITDNESIITTIRILYNRKNYYINNIDKKYDKVIDKKVDEIVNNENLTLSEKVDKCVNFICNNRYRRLK